MLLRSSWVGSPCADLPLQGGSDLFFVTVTVAVAVADAARAAAAAARGLRLHRIDGRTIGYSLDDAGDQCRSRAAGHRGSVSGPVLSTCGWPQRHWQATSAEHVRLATEALAGDQCRARAAGHRGTGRLPVPRARGLPQRHWQEAGLQLLPACMCRRRGQVPSHAGE